MSNREVGYGMVVFLIPDGYAHLEELTSCLEEARQSLNNPKVSIPSPIKWQCLVENLKEQEPSSLNELIREFYYHLSQRFESVSFSREEIMQLDRSSAMPMEKLMKAVERTFRHVKKKQSVSASSSITVQDGGEAVGFHFGHGKQCLWFGIWFRYWEDGSPLCLGAYRPDASNETLHAFRKLGADCTLDDHLVKGYPFVLDQDSSVLNSSVLIQEIIKDAKILLKSESQEA